MTIADVVGVLAALALAGTGLPALVALLHLLAPEVTERSSERLASHPVRSFATGLLSAIAILVVASISGNALAGPGKLLGVLALVLGFSAAGIGWAGFSLLIARRLAERSAREHSIPDVIAGALIVEFACAIPILGWLIVMPTIFLVALGAGVRSMLFRARRAVVAPVVDLGVDQHA
jgi:hypothetical protein